MNYPGLDGFLGTRASLMLDVVTVAMAVILPVLAVSIYLVRYRRRYLLHKRLQIGLSAVLFAAVTLFELDMRVNGWRHRAAASPYYSEDGTSLVSNVLRVHLVFAISTAALWVAVLVQALLKFPRPPAPSLHSRQHILWGRLAALDLTLTAVTGWLFYWLAFVA